MKNKVMALIAAAIFSVSAFSAPVQQSIGASVTAEAATTKVATPTASRKSASYYCTKSLKITLSCATKGATIYYSANGGKSYKVYSKPLYATGNVTLKFYAVKDGVKSAVASRTYKLVPRINTSLASGTYKGTQKVYLSSPASGVKFYYTLDGSTPTTASTLYTAKGITISKSCKLRVLAVKSKWSTIKTTRTYVIEKEEKPVIDSGSVLDDYTSKFGYSTLNDDQKKLYVTLCEGIANHESEISISKSLGITEYEFKEAFYAVVDENPQFFWVSSGYSCTLIGGVVTSAKPIYSRTKSEAAAIQPKLEAAAQKIINGALKKDTLFERVLYIHDAVVNGTTYTLKGNESIRGADGPLVNGKALCEGYSDAFSYLCQSIGIQTTGVTGSANGGDHMWTAVKLDGDWYQFDVTFDDPTGGEPVCRYTYFGLTTKEMCEDHVIDCNHDVPNCTADEYNYYNAMGITLYTNASTAYNALIKQAAANYNKGIYTTEIYCDDGCESSLYSLIKGKSVFTDLKANGCSSNSYKYGYSGNVFFLTLS
ncbi:MAG: hypothetical protein E7485_07185 [Ruminococcaceae bacterium]|nr:hypothetical protein [Oscillospiraceae bacterium]